MNFDKSLNKWATRFILLIVILIILAIIVVITISWNLIGAYTLIALPLLWALIYAYNRYKGAK